MSLGLVLSIVPATLLAGLLKTEHRRLDNNTQNTICYTQNIYTSLK